MQLLLKDVRIAFCHTLFNPKQVNGEGDPKHSAVFILPTDLQPVAVIETDGKKTFAPTTWDAALKSVATTKWADKAIPVLKDLLGKGRVCFHKDAKTNSSGEVYDGFEGTYHINASSKKLPKIVDLNPRVVLTEKDGRIYPGCYVNASVALWPQDHAQFGKRINATLVSVQFLRDGEAFTGEIRSDGSEFEDLSAGSNDAALV